VAVDAPALAGAQADQVEAERADAELAPERLEALLSVAVERHHGDAFLHPFARLAGARGLVVRSQRGLDVGKVGLRAVWHDAGSTVPTRCTTPFTPA
jgi:hypothetical protein